MLAEINLKRDRNIYASVPNPKIEIGSIGSLDLYFLKIHDCFGRATKY